jgi:hypothetical protein
VQRGAFDVEPVGRDLSGTPVSTRAHRVAPGQAGVREVGEGVAGGQEVRCYGDQVGLRDADRGLRAALELGVVGNATDDLAAVVPARGDHLRVPDRDPGDVLDGDRLRVVGQHVGLSAVDPPQRGVQQHRKVRARVEHTFSRIKNYKILRDCRQRGDGLHHAVQSVARMHNLAIAA